MLEIINQRRDGRLQATAAVIVSTMSRRGGRLQPIISNVDACRAKADGLNVSFLGRRRRSP